MVEKAPRPPQTLSSSLQLLSGEDPDCLFIVRRINKLGFKASRTLKQYFSAKGQVVRVLVAHSTVRQQGDPSCQARRRPSSLGFVQMQSPEAVRRVLADGLEQEVKGAVIRVQKFEHHRVGEDDHEEDDEVLDLHPCTERVLEWQRDVSSCSTASCATAASWVSASTTSEEHFGRLGGFDDSE